MKKQIGMALVGVVLAIGTLVGCTPPEPRFDASRGEESLHEMGMYLSKYQKHNTLCFLAAKRTLEAYVLTQAEKYETYNNYSAVELIDTMQAKYKSRYFEECDIVSRAMDRIR